MKLTKAQSAELRRVVREGGAISARLARLNDRLRKTIREIHQADRELMANQLRRWWCLPVS